MQIRNRKELNSEGREIKIWNVPTERAQKVDEVIILIIIFNPWVIVIKM